MYWQMQLPNKDIDQTTVYSYKQSKMHRDNVLLSLIYIVGLEVYGIELLGFNFNIKIVIDPWTQNICNHKNMCLFGFL